MLARLTTRVKEWLRRATSKRSAAPTPSAADEELAKLRRKHEQVRAEAHGEVDEVLTCTEQATLSVCGNLDRVVKEAQAFIGDVKDRMGSLENDHDGGGVSATLDRQCELVTSFLAELQAGLKIQREAASRMLATSQKVSQAADSVAQISTATRVLCLNTMIEAGRLGDDGQPMIVIADQMRSLSAQISSANTEIAELMAALVPTLEEVDTSTAQVEARATSFSGEFEVQASEVGSLAQQLRETTEAALGGGDEKLDMILGSSREALESLQTQDLVSQRLRRVLQLLDRTDLGLEEPQSTDPAPVATAESQQETANDTPSEEAASDKPDVYLSETMGGEDKRELEAGDMMMF